MIMFILNKSRNLANWLFIMTPALFTLILLFNMVNYYGNIINNFILWIPYLLAPLGMFLSSVYILKGPGFLKNRSLEVFLILYVLISIILSAYPNPFQFGQLTGLQQGLMHLYLIIPFIGTIYYFQKVIPEIPEQKQKIFYLIAGLVVVSLGSVFRAFEYISYEHDSTIGMLVIVLGSILTLMAFASVRRQDAGYPSDKYYTQPT